MYEPLIPSFNQYVKLCNLYIDYNITHLFYPYGNSVNLRKVSFTARVIGCAHINLSQMVISVVKSTGWTEHVLESDGIVMEYKFRFNT